MNNYLLNLNYYIFNNKEFFNKIIFDNIKKNIFYNEISIINYYYNLKYTLNYYNPFYGIKINSLLENLKKIKKKKKYFNEIFLYRNYNEYKIPYKDLTYIFNLSIETLRKILNNNV
ncbi:hypothetical protein A355_0144 [Candidatus Carsonella ruddii HT isolate Thao2000]|uniref:Uncharacterized protein n=1 Tax=Candidatus Carsonella ruddii HT isolate Thao2000 TaxID=1202539 RepID=J3Z1M0_CARRU|nr:hypothetical protein [Candidatus Carsonella ruddii]AFP84164.1 hypothetical protein A355_0144 [Candidatus Carsonella ruddii HT isolate Thao2000]